MNQLKIRNQLVKVKLKKKLEKIRKEYSKTKKLLGEVKFKIYPPPETKLIPLNSDSVLWKQYVYIYKENYPDVKLRKRSIYKTRNHKDDVFID